MYLQFVDKYIFIDRDGTIIREPKGFQIDTLEKISFLPGVISCLKKLFQHGYKLVMVSNQDDLGTEKYPQEIFNKVQKHLLDILASEDIFFEEILIDPHSQDHPNRKPNIGMLMPLIRQQKIDYQKSYVIGDRYTDALLAKNLGCHSITILDPKSIAADKVDWDQYETKIFKKWREIDNFLLSQNREATIHRKTNETNIHLSLNLDGSGKSDIQLELNFFKHMLENFTKHAGIDLSIHAKGDLEVDEHHLIEDTAIVLGEAFKKALADKRGIERYGFFLPMDESEVICGLDISGRFYLVFEAEFKREFVGDFPTELLKHFYYSLCNSAGFNLNLKIKGENEHHMIEASFKAFARCLKQAISVNQNSSAIPSTKGIL